MCLSLDKFFIDTKNKTHFDLKSVTSATYILLFFESTILKPILKVSKRARNPGK